MAQRGNLGFSLNLNPRVTYKLFPGLKGWLSVGKKGPKFGFSGDPKAILKALKVGSEGETEEETEEE